MTITRVGTTKKYADNWDTIFGSRGRASTTKKTAATKPVRQSTKKQSAAKPVRKRLKKNASRRK